MTRSLSSNILATDISPKAGPQKSECVKETSTPQLITITCKTINNNTPDIEDMEMVFNVKPLDESSEKKENMEPTSTTLPTSKTPIHLARTQIHDGIVMAYNCSPSSPVEFPRACCSEGIDLKYGTPNMFCAEPGCRIVAGAEYMEGKNGPTYCMPCFEEKPAADRKKEAKSWKKKLNLNMAEEQLRDCSKCGVRFHQCCSLESWVEPFICPHCPKTLGSKTMKLTLDERKRSKFEKFMEDKLNSYFKKERSEFSENKFSVISYRTSKSVKTRKLVPSKYYAAFANKYGDSINYHNRCFYLFQRRDGVDVLVYALFAQEYPSILGEGWVVIDYMDSVAHVQPANFSGYIFGEAIISYFSWMASFGYKNAHLFADPPVKHDDYIFNIHPKSQVYKEKEGLINYYRNVFSKGQEDGVIAKIRTFEETQKLKKYKVPTDLIPFDNGLWSRCMAEIDEELKPLRLSTGDYNHHFEAFIEEKFECNAKNNFFLKLAASGSRVEEKADAMVAPKILGDRDEFLEMCKGNNWEFSSLRRAKYASVGVISKIFGY